jgi:geranylgeranyl reductase family protein
MERYDVVVVGGGPAGSTAAYHIDGLKTLVVDKYDFPRFKACGGGLMSCRDWSAEFANFAAIESELAASAQPTDTLQMYWDETYTASRTFKHLFDQVSRDRLDDLLLKEALKKENVSFRRFAVDSIRYTIEGGVKWYILSDGKEDIYTRHIIGADGTFSRVAHFLRNRLRKPHKYGTCLEYSLECERKTSDVVVNAGYGGEIGYSWIFPTTTGYYVGLGVVRPPRKVLKQMLDEYMQWSVDQGFIPAQYTIKKTFGAAIPLSVVSRYCSDGVLLCGDAMGTVNVLIGEGIYYAMKSGKIAGETISESTEHLRRRYKRAIRPVIWEIFITPYIPHRIITVNFWKVVFALIRPLDRFDFVNAPLKLIIRRILHRYQIKDGYYTDERLSSGKAN